MNKGQKRTFDACADDGFASPDREQEPSSHRSVSRSCRGCYERKIRCDRASPCANCAKCGITCVYPTKDRDVARKSNTLQSICDRLERLENLLSQLVQNQQGPFVERRGNRDVGLFRVTDIPEDPVNSANATNVISMATTYQHVPGEHASPATWQLLLEDGSLNQSAKDPRIVPLAQEERHAEVPQINNARTATQGTQQDPKAQKYAEPERGVSDPSGAVAEVIRLYPDTKLALWLWDIYIKSVDPVIKILHIPSVQSSILSTILAPTSATPSMLALTFSIYYAAITALCHDKNEKNYDFHFDTPALLRRFKLALDRLLLTSDLMSRPKFTALQALTIYVACLRVHDISRNVWVLNGLAIRIAQTMGLDRDGTGFSFSLFETEMRLRLWWQLCILDSRAPEDHGFQPTADITNRHLRLPLNVNDNQIYPEMTQLPSESTGWTEMSFFLLQTDSCRILFPILNIQDQNRKDALSDIREKRKTVAERRLHVSIKYNIHSKSESAHRMLRIAEQHSATARLKMEFMLQLREELAMERPSEARGKTTPDVLKPSFKLACQTLESNYKLWVGDLTANFTWFFRMYAQWYALAHVLRCLCSCPSGSEADQAWTLVDALFPHEKRSDGQSPESHNRRGPTSIQDCLIVLRARALLLREQALSSADAVRASKRTPNTGVNYETAPVRDTGNVAQSSTAPAANEELHGEKSGEKVVFDYNDEPLSYIDLCMPDLPFLPDSDWDAVMKGWLDEDGQF